MGCDRKVNFEYKSEDEADVYFDYSKHVVTCASQRIQACHLDTLRSAFCLLVPEKYTIERIMADEKHVVAMSRVDSEYHMSIFDLQLASVETDEKFCLVERHFELTLTEPLLLFSVFLLDGWLVVPRVECRELVWFDKRSGKRSATSTKLNNNNNMSKLRAIYSSGSSLFFELNECQLLLKRL